MSEGAVLPAATAPDRAGTAMPLKDLLAYASAQIGSSLFFHVPLMLLMPFLTNLLAVPAAIAGLVIFLPKIWVVFCDPAMGALSDRVRTRAGRRRPFVLWGGIATAVSFTIVFAAPVLPNPWLTAGLVAILYLIGSTAYSAYSVPYLAMASEIAPRRELVTLVTSWRMAFNFLGAFLAGLAPMVVQTLGGGRPGYLGMSMILAAVCLGSVLIFYVGTRRTPTKALVETAKPSFAEWTAILKDRNFTVLAQTYFIQLLGIGVIQSAFAYYVIYRIGGDLGALSRAALIMTFGSLIAQPLWVRLAARYGKLVTYRIAVVALMLAEALFLLPGAGGVGLLYGACFGVGLAAAGYTLMAWSTMYDLIDQDAVRTGFQRAGAYTGIWSACEKVAIAVGVLTTGLLLQAAGFHPSSAGFTAQSPMALVAVRYIPGIVPSVLLAVSLLSLMRFRPLPVCEPAR